MPAPVLVGQQPYVPAEPPKLPIPKDGVRARSLGRTWWGRRWLELLERFAADFARDANRRSHVFYRWINELPLALLAAIVVLVVVKPF